MEDIQRCGNEPKKIWWLGRLSVAEEFLRAARIIARTQQADTGAIRQYVVAADMVLSSLADRASHCDLVPLFDEATAAAQRVLDALADGTPVGPALTAYIKITIKIGKLIIIIEW